MSSLPKPAISTKLYFIDITTNLNVTIKLLSPPMQKSSDEILKNSIRIRVQLDYHFLSTLTRNPKYSVGTCIRRSMYAVLDQKKGRVHEFIWPSLQVTNKNELLIANCSQ